VAGLSLLQRQKIPIPAEDKDPLGMGRGGRRQCIEHGIVCHPVLPLRVASQAVHCRHRLGTNQRGEVQAIGGVNEKLEGFFEVCKAKGLTGEQGAMIPASNVQNLMLKEELLEAAEAGKFSIYPARTIDEGIEFLTGVAAGEREPDGSYKEGTVNYLVDKRLREMAEMAREFQLPVR
jgi:hypothetical protein